MSDDWNGAREDGCLLGHLPTLKAAWLAKYPMSTARAAAKEIGLDLRTIYAWQVLVVMAHTKEGESALYGFLGLVNGRYYIKDVQRFRHHARCALLEEIL